MSQKILIIDDDADLVTVLSELLAREGFQVGSALEAQAGLELVDKNPPDLVLLDVRMPGLNGLDVCRAIKSKPTTKHIPIVIMSVKTDEADVVVGLEMGAEDYIRKPVQKAELLARLRTVLRRRETTAQNENIVIGPLTINVPTYTARINDAALDLRPKEFELLLYLARHEGLVVTRHKISETVWTREHLPNSLTIESHIHQLRKKLGVHGRWIESLKGIGYRFEVDE